MNWIAVSQTISLRSVVILIFPSRIIDSPGGKRRCHRHPAAAAALNP